MEKQLIMTYGNDARQMTKEVLKAAGLESMIPKGALIGIKPNLVVARPSTEGATTSPVMVDALIEYLKEHGHQRMIIIEGSWIGDSTKRAFKVCGYEDISRKHGVPLFDTKTDTYSVKSFKGIDMEISDKAMSVDFMINMPVLKGHCQTMITGALKNMKGLISDREKRHFHTLGLDMPIAYLNKLIRTDFVLVDGLCGDLDFEEGGNPVQMDRIFCCTDPVLADAYIAATMGYQPTDIHHVRIASELGIGSCDLDAAKITVLNKDTAVARPSASRKVQQLARYAKPVDACSACYANLIHAFSRLEDEGLLQRYRSNPVLIGQGYKGKQCAGIGVGVCTALADKSVKGCPPSTQEILKFLREQAK